MEDKIPDNPNAFPTNEHTNYGDDRDSIQTYFGMTLRDYFAAKILPACIASCDSYEDAAQDAYQVADKMLIQRLK